MERLSTEALLSSLLPGVAGLSQNSAGWNYTGWASSHPRSSWARRGCRQSSPRDRRKGARIRMAAGLYWLDGPWAGKMALAARPRGGDWLGDEMVRNWKQLGIDWVLSLLTPEEEREMDLGYEASEAQGQGLEFTSFPIPDRQVPKSEAKLVRELGKVEHCFLLVRMSSFIAGKESGEADWSRPAF